MTKYAGRQLELLIGDGGSPENFAVVGQVTSLGEAGSSRDLIDASAYGDDWKDYVVGQQDGAELEVQIAYDPANTQHDAIQSAYAAATKRNFQLRHTPAGFQVQFPAYVTAFSRGAERDGLLQLSATLKIVAPGVTDLT
ncbi:MAG TPA: phage tail tube protein [Actinomycetota bacterium]|nr:phage tail tube protein [Actinomycetota bacterium]